MLLTVLEVNCLVNGLDEADLDVLGGNRHRGGALPQPVSGYHPEQPAASLNFPGSECCFLRMFMPPSSLPLWNVLLSSVCVCLCVCEMVVTIILYSSGLAGSTGRKKKQDRHRTIFAAKHISWGEDSVYLSY